MKSLGKTRETHANYKTEQRNNGELSCVSIDQTNIYGMNIVCLFLDMYPAWVIPESEWGFLLAAGSKMDPLSRLCDRVANQSR